LAARCTRAARAMIVRKQGTAWATPWLRLPPLAQRSPPRRALTELTVSDLRFTSDVRPPPRAANSARRHTTAALAAAHGHPTYQETTKVSTAVASRDEGLRASMPLAASTPVRYHPSTAPLRPGRPTPRGRGTTMASLTWRLPASSHPCTPYARGTLMSELAAAAHARPSRTPSVATCVRLAGHVGVGL